MTRIKSALLFALAAAPTLVCAQSTKQIDVTEPRPLASAIEALEAATGSAINYEDPPYENEADLEDVATPQQRSAEPGYRLLVPRTGHIAAQVHLAGNASIGDALVGLALLLDRYRQEKLPGDFKIEQANAMIYVTPTSVLSESGSVRQVTSPLMVKITVPFASRSVAETAQAIFDAVNRTSGMKIAIGSFPYWPTDVVNFGADKEVARDALARMFALAGNGPMSYSLGFDPKPDRMRIFDYMINVRPAGYVPPVAPQTREPAIVPPSELTPSQLRDARRPSRMPSKP